jgi:hypothetical protein
LDTAAITHDPSVGMDCLTVGGDVLTSQTLKVSCVQNTTSAEFWDSETLMLLLDLLLLDVEVFVMLLREITSTLSDSTVDEDKELVSPEPL